MKYKVFIITFKGLPLKDIKNFLEGESSTLRLILNNKKNTANQRESVTFGIIISNMKEMVIEIIPYLQKNTLIKFNTTWEV